MNFKYNLHSSGKVNALVITVLTFVNVVGEDSLVTPQDSAANREGGGGQQGQFVPDPPSHNL